MLIIFFLHGIWRWLVFVSEREREEAARFVRSRDWEKGRRKREEKKELPLFWVVTCEALF